MHHVYHLATAYGRSGEYDSAFDLLTKGIRAIETTGEHMFEAELYRLRGELLLKTDRANEGEGSLMTALAVARRQQARAWELRAAIALAHHWSEYGKTPAARDLLSPIHGWFTEGFDTRDLKEAKALLAALDA